MQSTSTVTRVSFDLDVPWPSSSHPQELWGTLCTIKLGDIGGNCTAYGEVLQEKSERWATSGRQQSAL